MRRSPWAVAAVVLIAIVLLMAVEDRAGGLLNELLLHLPGADKVMHVAQSLLVFAVMHWLARRAAIPPARALLGSALAALGVAIVDEVQQQWSGGRSVEVADVLAGASGIALGVAWWLRSVRPRVALGVAAVALSAAVGLTYRSHQLTRDYNWGVLAEREGRQIDAVRHYRAAAAAMETNPEAYNALAWAIAESGIGDPKEAVAAAERSLQIRPGHADTLDTYGWALYRAGRAADAVTPLEQALAAKPDIYCVRYHLGMAYLDAGRRDAAVQQLRAQVEQMPATREATLAAERLSTLGVAVAAR